MATATRPKTVPKNFPPAPASYPVAMFRPQIDAARRYLFESELKEVLEMSGLPLTLLDPDVGDIPVTVAHVAAFVQGLKEVTGEEQARAYGRDAFKRTVPLLARGSTGLPPILRAVSAVDKLFLRIRDVMSVYNRAFDANILVKWHGGAESQLFEDTAQHCYGFTSDVPICQTMTGFLEEAINSLSGIKVTMVESDCMAKGALACRWHCELA